MVSTQTAISLNRLLYDVYPDGFIHISSYALSGCSRYLSAFHFSHLLHDWLAFLNVFVKLHFPLLSCLMFALFVLSERSAMKCWHVQQFSFPPETAVKIVIVIPPYILIYFQADNRNCIKHFFAVITAVWMTPTYHGCIGIPIWKTCFVATSE